MLPNTLLRPGEGGMGGFQGWGRRGVGGGGGVYWCQGAAPFHLQGRVTIALQNIFAMTWLHVER